MNNDTRQLKGSLHVFTWLCYLLLADSIKPMLGTCEKDVNYYWFLCYSWHPNGASLACLGAFGEIDSRPLRCSPHPLPLLHIFCTPSKFWPLHGSFWKRLLRRLPLSEPAISKIYKPTVLVCLAIRFYMYNPVEISATNGRLELYFFTN